MGYATHECNKIKPNFPPFQRNWIKGRQVQFKEENETQNVNHKNFQSSIHVVSTRATRAKQLQLSKALDAEESDPKISLFLIIKPINIPSIIEAENNEGL